MSERSKEKRTCQDCGARWPLMLHCYAKNSYKVVCRICGVEFERGKIKLGRGIVMQKGDYYPNLSLADVDERIDMIAKANDSAL